MNINYKIYLFICSIFIASIINAQTYIVADEYSKEPLSFVNITVIDSERGFRSNEKVKRSPCGDFAAELKLSN